MGEVTAYPPVRGLEIDIGGPLSDEDLKRLDDILPFKGQINQWAASKDECRQGGEDAVQRKTQREGRKEMSSLIEVRDPDNPEKSLTLVREPVGATAPGLWLYTEGGEGMAVSEGTMFKLLDEFYRKNF